MNPFVTVRTASPQGGWLLASPSVGIWRTHLRLGSMVREGDAIGTLSLLGRAQPLLSAAEGWVEALLSGQEAAVAFGTPLVQLAAAPQHRLDDDGAPSAAETKLGTESFAEAFAFRAPMSGRFFCRPSPDELPFVKPGELVQAGAPLAILEIMKTFHRLHYEGTPHATAEVVRIVAEEGSDVRAGDALLLLRPRTTP